MNYCLGDALRLADFFNVVVYGGKRVILPQHLADVQKCYQKPIWDRYGKAKVSRRERDVAKLLCRDGHPVLLAVENQDHINYCMPLRCAEYDLADLNRQLRRLKRHYAEEGTLKGTSEFLSGMKEADQLIPSVTIVFYHGKGKWDGTKQLQQLLDLEGTDKQLQSFLEDYHIHVVSLEELDEDKFETDLREVIGIAKRREDKCALRTYCETHADRLRNLNEDVYDLICAFLNRETLLQKKQHYYNEESEDFNMCKAMDDWEMEARETGRKEGRKDGIKIGEKRGEKRGEQRMTALMSQLFQEGRIEDARRALHSASLRKRLYLEYGI